VRLVDLRVVVETPLADGRCDDEAIRKQMGLLSAY